MSDTRTNWKNKGLCPGCGGSVNDRRYTYCVACREKDKETRNAAKQQGICASCFSNNAEDGFVTCKECREKHKAWTDDQKKNNKWKSIKLRRTEQGLCQVCGKLREDRNYTRCIACREKNKLEAAEARKNGKCIRCKKQDRHNDFLTCQECRKDSRERRHWLKEMGLCQHCEKNQITPGIGLRGQHVTCEECRQKQTAKYQSRKTQCLASGICVQCNKRQVVIGQMNCPICILKSVSRTHFGTANKWKELGDIFLKQKCECTYTGLKIMIGINAALDHIIPQSAGGINDISNVQWVHKYANIAKHAHSESEFFSLIKMIYDHCKLHDFVVTGLSTPGRRFAKKDENAA